VGFATSLPLVESPTSIVDFPADLDFSIDGVPFPAKSFLRPVLRAVVQFPNDHPVTIFVTHLKSKRPMVAPDKRHDPKEETLGKARSLIIRAAEAAALRSIIVDELQNRRDHVVAEQAFIQEAILDARLRELADMYLRQHVETLTMACELFGCKEPKLDAELIFATFLTIEQRLLVHPEKISQEFVEKRMYNMLDKVVPLHG
jgi:hypothetical protein